MCVYIYIYLNIYLYYIYIYIYIYIIFKCYQQYKIYILIIKYIYEKMLVIPIPISIESFFSIVESCFYSEQCPRDHETYMTIKYLVIMTGCNCERVDNAMVVVIISTPHNATKWSLTYISLAAGCVSFSG